MNKVTKGFLIAIIVVALIILVPIVLIFTTVEGATYYSKAKDYIAGKTYAKPVKNNHPTNYLVVTGHIPPDMKVILSVGYVANNPKCDVTDNWLEGASGSRGTSLYYPIKTNMQGNYKVVLALDGLLQGTCKWRSELVLYQVFSKDGKLKSSPQYAVGFLRKKPQGGTLPYKIVVECRKFGDQEYPLSCGNVYPTHFNGLNVNAINQFTMDFRGWGKNQ